MVRIQSDEYGEGRPGRSHAELFAATMEAVGLDPAPGAYIDLVPGCLLATDNLVSLFGLHRSTMAELMGTSLFEMTSVVPMARYATGIRRLTGSDAAAEFYDVHVVADEVHARWAADEMAAGFVGSPRDVRRGAVRRRRAHARRGRVHRARARAMGDRPAVAPLDPATDPNVLHRTCPLTFPIGKPRLVSEQESRGVTMNGLSDAEARAALDEVERSRHKVIDEIDMPPGTGGAWPWGGSRSASSPTSQHAWLTAAATLAFGAMHSAVSQRVIGGRHRTTQLSVRERRGGRHSRGWSSSACSGSCW